MKWDVLSGSLFFPYTVSAVRSHMLGWSQSTFTRLSLPTLCMPRHGEKEDLTLRAGHGQFSCLGAVAVGSSGNVYVADSHNNRIQKFRRSFGMRGMSWRGEWPTVEWDSESGKVYRVWVSAGLLDWVTAPGTTTGSATSINLWSDDGSPPLGSPAGAGHRFYRIELLD